MSIWKKFLSVFLSMMVIFNFSSTLVFGSINSSSISTQTVENEIEPFNNRYYYETVTGGRRLSITNYNDSQARNMNLSYGVATAAIAAAGAGGVPTSLIYLIGGAIYDTRVAGSIWTYTTDSTRYRVHRLTGARHIVSQSRYVEVNVYTTSGVLHRAFTHNLRLK